MSLHICQSTSFVSANQPSKARHHCTAAFFYTLHFGMIMWTLCAWEPNRTKFKRRLTFLTQILSDEPAHLPVAFLCLCESAIQSPASLHRCIFLYPPFWHDNVDFVCVGAKPYKIQTSADVSDANSVR